MLNIKKYKKLKEINHKMIAIVVTNVCDLSCGGCNQFCGHFPKEKTWFVSLEDFEKNIVACTKWADAHWKKIDFPNENKNIVIYGGEPLIHPEWDKLCQLMEKYSSYNFLVYTNGFKIGRRKCSIEIKFHDEKLFTCERKLKTWGDKSELEVGNEIKNKHKITCSCLSENMVFLGFGNMFDSKFRMDHSQKGNLIYSCLSCGKYAEVFITPPETRKIKKSKNIKYLVCEKDKNSLRSFVPTLVAPVDLDENKKTKYEYWEQAKERCYVLNECETSIYNKKGYFCIVAAAMDHMFYDGKYGWKFDSNENPMNKSYDQIKDQAVNFCYRCGFCVGNRKKIESFVGQKQLACNKTLCSSSNFVDIQELKKIKKI